MVFYYVDALCGAGKTREAVRYAFDQARWFPKKFLIVLPSKLMTSQVEADLARMNTKAKVPVHRFDRDVCGDGMVRRRIIEHLKQADADQSEIVLVTHAGFAGLRYFHRPDRWNVIIDESLSIFQSQRLNLPRQSRSLLELVQPVSLIPDLPDLHGEIRQRGQEISQSDHWGVVPSFSLGVYEFVQGEEETYPVRLGTRETSWDEFVEMVRSEADLPKRGKSDQFHITQNPTRTDPTNAPPAGFIGFDVDGQITIEEAVTIIRRCQLEAVIHTTASHREKQHRFRLLIPIAQGVIGSDYREVYWSIARLFGLERADRKDGISALFGLPAKFEGVANRFVHQEGFRLTAADWIDLMRPIDEGFIRLEPTETGRIEEIRRQAPEDDLDRPLQQLADWLTNPHMSCEVSVSQWRRFVEDQDEDDRGRGQLDIFGHLRASLIQAGFNSVTLMSANIGETLMFQDWSRAIEFKPHPIIGSGNYRFDYTQHDGSSLRIICLSGGGFSKNWRDKEGNWDRLKEKALSLIGEAEYVYVQNNDKPDLEQRGTRLPHNCHGLNSFMSTHVCLFLSAQLPSPLMLNWLESKGLTRYQVKAAWSFQTAYQVLMRTSLRDPGSTDPVTMIVADLDIAAYLHHRMFPGSQIQLNEVEATKPKPVGRPTIGDRPMSAAEKKRRSRQLRKVA